MACGLAVTAGWGLTQAIARESFEAVNVQSLSFSGPSAEWLMRVLASSQIPGFGFDAGLLPATFVGSLIGGSTRRLVIKLTCPAGDPGDTLAVRAIARWQTPGGGAPLAADIAVPELRFASDKACQEQPRNVATVRLVAERWQAHVYHRAMVLNQDGQGQAASDYVRRQFQYLMRYCDGIVELREAMRSLEMFGESVRNRYSASSSKEMMLRAYKMHRGESDHRGREAVDFAALMEEEENLRRASGRRGP